MQDYGAWWASLKNSTDQLLLRALLLATGTNTAFTITTMHSKYSSEIKVEAPSFETMHFMLTYISKDIHEHFFF